MTEPTGREPDDSQADAVESKNTDGGTTDSTETGIPAEDPRISELSNLVVHLKADFDNYRKRASKEMAASVRTGELEAVRKFLPAFANLERALAAARADETPVSALVDGIRQIHEQFQSILKTLGVERIEAKGVAFDPSLHEAVAAAPSHEVPPGTVLDE